MQRENKTLVVDALENDKEKRKKKGDVTEWNSKMWHGVLPHNTVQTWGVTGQPVSADKTIVIFTRASVQFVTVAALNWTLGFFSGGTGTITEEKGCTSI